MPKKNGFVIPAYPLPAKRTEFIELRQSAKGFTLSDIVEGIHLSLYDKPEYRALLDAVSKEQSVEGTPQIDNVMAAQMIREAGISNPVIAGATLHAINKALNVVMRRYGSSRKERREAALATANATHGNA